MEALFPCRLRNDQPQGKWAKLPKAMVGRSIEHSIGQITGSAYFFNLQPLAPTHDQPLHTTHSRLVLAFLPLT
jgi:hypothetical protein